MLVQSKRNKHATLKLMRKLLKKYAFALKRLVTDDLRSYAPAAQDLGIEHLHERGRFLDPHPIVKPIGAREPPPSRRLAKSQSLKRKRGTFRGLISDTV